LPEIYPQDLEVRTQVQCEILHSIYAHDEQEQCLSIEAGIAKIADGTDMASGRARFPYRVEDTDIHSLSALAITRVAIEKSTNDRIRLIIYMKNPAGVFQIEEVLEEKIRTSGLTENVEVLGIYRGKLIKTLEFHGS
jgi:metal-dependent HD superfamily phosphatase/phosphodiesterase